MRFKYRLLPFFVTTALAGMGGAALAAPLPITNSNLASGQTAQAGWEVGTETPVRTGNDVSTDGIPGWVDVLNSDNDTGGDIFYHSYGSITNFGGVSFGSRASGTGVYDLTSAYHLRDYTFTVPSGVVGPIPVYFNFVIDNGELGVYCGTCTGGGFAQIQIAISVDGTTVASADAKLAAEAGTGNRTLTKSGDITSWLTQFDPSNVQDAYHWNPMEVSVFLGNFNANSTLSLDYDLITTAAGDFTGDEVAYAGEFCMPGGAAEATLAAAFVTNSCNGSYYFGNSIARIGDPFGPATGTGFNVANVPEPGSLALLAAGLGAASAFVGGRRRKRKKTAE